MFARGFKTWCENTAVSLRKKLGREPSDPVSPEALAKLLEVRIWQAEEIPGVDPESLRILLHEDPDSWSAITIHVQGQAIIVLNSAHSGGRPSSNLMHELAHILLNHEPSRLDVSDDGVMMLRTFDRQQEAEADWLAGCILLPRPTLLACRKLGLENAAIARRYGVSQKMVEYRLNVTGVDTQLARGRR